MTPDEEQALALARSTCWLPDRIPRNEDDDPIPEEECPWCGHMTPVEEAGISYCTACYRVLFVSDALHLLWPERRLPQCPYCGAFADHWMAESSNIMAEDDDVAPAGRGAGRFFCYSCGRTVRSAALDRDGYQFYRVEDDAGG